jgi:hypothetical protein
LDRRADAIGHFELRPAEGERAGGPELGELVAAIMERDKTHDDAAAWRPWSSGLSLRVLSLLARNLASISLRSVPRISVVSGP